MMDKSLFKFSTQVKVRSHEIDWQGVVHYANYLLYFETGRLEYLTQLGVTLDLNTMPHELKVVVARNETDYLSPARFGQSLDVYTRISSIRNSSFVFEGIIEESGTGRRIAENVAIHVWMDERRNAPQPVPDGFRRLVEKFEGDAVRIDWPSSYI